MPNDRQARRLAQQAVVEAMVTHSVWLHRASTTQVNRMLAEFDELAGQLASTLSDRLDNLAPAELAAFTQGRYTTDRLKGLRNVIDRWAESLATAINTENASAMEELAGYEANYARNLVANAVTGTVAAAPSAAAVYREAMQQPVLGEMVEDMLSAAPDRARRQVYSAIRQGVSQGNTNQQIVRSIRGTRAMRYKDGVLQSSRTEIERVVRTARNHVSNVAYEETYQALGIEELVWTSTLDGRTCLVAGSLVDTPNGKRPIESLAEGDAVMGGSGAPKLITGTLSSSARKLCRVTLSNGEKVTCTQDHLFWTSRGWVEAKDLSAGEKLPDRL